MRYFESMNNYIDIATPKELEAHYGYLPEATELESEREHFTRDKDHNLVCLYLLFLERGANAKAKAYFSQIENPERQLEAAMLAGECVEA